ncbi:MAG: hypothetical protein JWO15_736 [Sphingomonadales bacterium]|nr:hypothetical protein [Sphingomonadales bacterium]
MAQSSTFPNFCFLGCASAVLLIAAPAQAATASTTFAVSATVLKACLVTATPLAFGNYDPTSAVPLDSTATLSVLCTVGTPFTVGLNAGTFSGATVTTRRMANGANTLNYSLYQETGRTTNWGNTPASDVPASTTAPISATGFTVYGRVAALQNVPALNYTDSITVTVNY